MHLWALDGSIEAERPLYDLKKNWSFYVKGVLFVVYRCYLHYCLHKAKPDPRRDAGQDITVIKIKINL